MTERTESAAERLTRVIHGNYANPEEEQAGNLLLALQVNEEGTGADELVRIITSWSVAPAIREAVRDMDTCIAVMSEDRQRSRNPTFEDGIVKARLVLKRRLEPLGLWPGGRREDVSEITDMVREAFAIDKEARRLAREEAITALRAAVEEVERRASWLRNRQENRDGLNIDRATGVDDALEILDKHLAPWLGEEGS